MIPTIAQEKKIVVERERRKRVPLSRPKKYNVVNPGDEQFDALPLDVQFERVVRLELSLKRRQKKLAKVKRAVAMRARRKRMMFKAIVRDDKLIRVETIPMV